MFIYFLLYVLQKIDLTVTNSPNASDKPFLKWTKINDEKIFYKIFQKKENEEWKQISTYSKGEVIKVLNVYPHITSTGPYYTYHVPKEIPLCNFVFDNDPTLYKLSKSASLKVWMEGGTRTCGNVIQKFEALGKDPETGKQQITVQYLSITEFGSNPSIINNYDVVVFGSWYVSNYVSVTTDTAQNIIKPFIENGGGVIATHGVISKIFVGFTGKESLTYLAKSHFGIEICPLDRHCIEDLGFSSVRLKKKGILTSYPWDLKKDVGDIINIPTTRSFGKYVNGELWLSGIIKNHEMDRYISYLSTYENTAVMEIGQAQCDTLVEERKILANLIYYLKRKTEKTELIDYSINDDKEPIIKLDCSLHNQKINWEWLNIGNKYGYKVQAFKYDNPNTVIGESDPEYITINTKIKGFYYVINEDNSTLIIGNEKLEYYTEETSYLVLNNDVLKYFHIATINFDGKLGKTAHCKIPLLPTPTISDIPTQNTGNSDNGLISSLSTSTQYVLIGSGCVIIIISVVLSMFIYGYFKNVNEDLDKQISFKINQNLATPVKVENPLFDNMEADPFAKDFYN